MIDPAQIPVSRNRFTAWLRSIFTNRLDEEWDELKAMSDDELCAEFDRLSVTKNIGARYRRTCLLMGIRFYDRHMTEKMRKE